MTLLDYEESLEAEVPNDASIYRINNPQQEDVLINIAKKILRKKSEKRSHDASPIKQKTERSTITANTSPLDKLTHLYKKFYRNWIAIPDDYNTWARNSFSLALEIIEKHNIDLIYVSLPPFSALGLAAKLKESKKIPLVVDYRDLWSGDVLREWVPTLRAKYELFLEKRYLKNADAIITVSEQKTDYIRNLVKNSIRCETITNGFDLDSFEELLNTHKKSIPTNDEINIVYCGRLFKNRKGYNFIEALGIIKSKNENAIKPIKVNFYGDIEKSIFDNYQKIIKEYQLQSNFIFHGDVSFKTTKKALVTSDFLLLIVDTGETTDGVIPGKLFE